MRIEPMPRGGKRPNSGRKPGSVNRPRAAAALLAATPETGPRESSIEAMREMLAEFRQLAKTAKAAGDVANHKSWSMAALQAARDLLPFEQPKLAAQWTLPADPSNKTTRFVLNIFDNQRRPLELPFPSDSAPEAEPKTEAVTVDAVATEPGKPAEEWKLPEVKPEEPPSDASGNGDPHSWARAQHFQAFFGTTRQPCGSRHRW
jgi:hypothetical protein